MSFYLINEWICSSSELSFHFVAKDRPDKYGEICLLINLIIVIIYKEHYMTVIQSQIYR